MRAMNIVTNNFTVIYAVYLKNKNTAMNYFLKLLSAYCVEFFKIYLGRK